MPGPQERDLINVVNGGQQENASIEYKASATLSFDDRTPLDRERRSQKTLGEKHREEFIFDVAAMANGEGGKIYTGVKADRDGFPVKTDEGFDTSKLNADGMEQILLNNIHPPLEGLSIETIEMKSKGNGRFAFIIHIPKATRNAPHQTPDYRYHRRHERTRRMMNDSEVRDAMKRAIDYGRQYGAAWDLGVEVARLAAAIKERNDHDGAYHVPRARLVISVSSGLRSAGNAMILLPKSIRRDAALLVASIDTYNAVIETVDPGQQENARVSEALKARLSDMLKQAEELAVVVTEILDGEP
jgi:Putative DNA-binding domain